MPQRLVEGVPHLRLTLGSEGPSQEPGVELSGGSTLLISCEWGNEDEGRYERALVDLQHNAEETE